MRLLLKWLLAPLALTYAYGLMNSMPPMPLKDNNMQTQFTWKMLEFSFPSEAQKQKAVDSGNFVQNNGIPIDVQPHYYNKNMSRTFVTIPRFQSGIPYTLATATANKGPGGPMLEPYPNYDAHNVNGDNCDKITSAFRVATTECNQMWVIDSGSVGLGAQCPPQVLLYDLNTDQLIHRYQFNSSAYTAHASLLVTPIVVVRDPPPRGSCRRAMVYIADVNYHGLVVYDFMKNEAWRIENKFMYPDPDYGTHTVAGESFTLMDGIIGMTTDKQNLYFHPMATAYEYVVPLRVIDNSTNFASGVDAMPQAFRTLGKRSSECVATATDSRNNVYCVTLNPIELIVWNIGSPYHMKSFKKLPINPQLLQFVSGMKVVTNNAGKEELWMISNRFQKVAAGTQNANDVNFRIIVYNLGNARTGTHDLHNKLPFSA